MAILRLLPRRKIAARLFEFASRIQTARAASATKVARLCACSPTQTYRIGATSANANARRLALACKLQHNQIALQSVNLKLKKAKTNQQSQTIKMLPKSQQQKWACLVLALGSLATVASQQLPAQKYQNLAAKRQATSSGRSQWRSWRTIKLNQQQQQRDLEQPELSNSIQVAVEQQADNVASPLNDGQDERQLREKWLIDNVNDLHRELKQTENDFEHYFQVTKRMIALNEQRIRQQVAATIAQQHEQQRDFVQLGYRQLEAEADGYNQVDDTGAPWYAVFWPR